MNRQEMIDEIEQLTGIMPAPCPTFILVKNEEGLYNSSGKTFIEQQLKIMYGNTPGIRLITIENADSNEPIVHVKKFGSINDNSKYDFSSCTDEELETFLAVYKKLEKAGVREQFPN